MPIDDLPEWEHPASVTIPCPMLLARKRGVFAKKCEDFPTSVRLTPHDKLLVEREAKMLGMTYSTFMRWVGVQVARELTFLRTGEKPQADL